MSSKSLVLVALAIFFAALPCLAQTSPPSDSSQAPASSDQAQVLKTTDAYVRNLFAWGPDFQVKLGPLSQSAAAPIPAQTAVPGLDRSELPARVRVGRTPARMPASNSIRHMRLARSKSC